MKVISMPATHRKRIIRTLTVVLMLLLIPLVAMQFSEEVVWSAFDFVIAGLLLFLSGLGYEFGVKGIRSITWRLASTALLLAVLFLVWLELAVGVFGSPFAGS